MKFIVRAALTLPAGTALGLSKAQAADRAHVLTPVDGRKGWFTANAAVQFKVDEEIAFEGDLPKAQAESLEEIQNRAAAAEKAAAEKAAAEKAAADAAAGGSQPPAGA